MTIKFTKSLDSEIYNDSLAIRREVFIAEQGVSEELEIEGEEGCLHFVLYQNDKPVATCRLYETEKNIGKLQRMAVAKNSRKSGTGKQLLTEVEKIALQHDFESMILGAQNTAIGFYEKLGYQIIGDEFMDAGIPHHMMEKNL